MGGPPPGGLPVAIVGARVGGAPHRGGARAERRWRPALPLPGGAGHAAAPGDRRAAQRARAARPLRVPVDDRPARGRAGGRAAAYRPDDRHVHQRDPHARAAGGDPRGVRGAGGRRVRHDRGTRGLSPARRRRGRARGGRRRRRARRRTGPAGATRHAVGAGAGHRPGQPRAAAHPLRDHRQHGRAGARARARAPPGPRTGPLRRRVPATGDVVVHPLVVRSVLRARGRRAGVPGAPDAQRRRRRRRRGARPRLRCVARPPRGRARGRGAGPAATSRCGSCRAWSGTRRRGSCGGSSRCPEARQPFGDRNRPGQPRRGPATW